MINFSDYNEENIFKVPDTAIEDAQSRLPDFRETPFNERRVHYINYLENTFNKFLARLYQIESTVGTGPSDPILSDLKLIIERIKLDPPHSYFEVEREKITSGNCLGTDYAYDFYRDLVGYGSRLEGLKTYDESYMDIFDDAYQTVNQIFNTIGTRGQFYGYLDQEIKILGDYIEEVLLMIESESTWVGANNIIISEKSNIDLALDTFNTNVVLGASDMRLIVEPIIKYLNLIELGSNIIEINWGGYAISENLRSTINQYNRAAYGFEQDYIIQSKGITSQILEQFRPSLKPDRSNFELILTKSIKIAFTKIGVTSDLEATKTEIIIPQY